jgi:hypothetical protein
MCGLDPRTHLLDKMDRRGVLSKTRFSPAVTTFSLDE